jgi:hypothetical protein
MVDPRDFRLRYFILLICVAALIAALLRHVLHIYGGFSREDIRADALIAALLVAVIATLLRRRGNKSS